MVWREKSEERDSLLHKNRVWAHPAASEGHLDMERALQCWDKRALHQLLVPSSSHPWLWHFSWQCFRPLLPKMTGIGFLIFKCLKMFRWRFKVAQIIFLRGYLLYMLTWQSCLFACCARNYVKKNLVYSHICTSSSQLRIPWKASTSKHISLEDYVWPTPLVTTFPVRFSLLNTAEKYCLRNVFVSFHLSASSHCSQEIQKSHQTHEREVSDSRKHEKHNSSIAFPPASWRNTPQGQQKFIFHWDWHKHLTTCIIMNIIILMLCLTLLLIFPSTHSSVW